MGFGSFGGMELIIALVIILLLFGAKRIPELAKGLGTGVREFRKGSRGDYEVEEEKKEEKNEELAAGEEKPEARSENAEQKQKSAEQKQS
jgi:sec-independent protein translocase protein TatA